MNDESPDPFEDIPYPNTYEGRKPGVFQNIRGNKEISISLDGLSRDLVSKRTDEDYEEHKTYFDVNLARREVIKTLDVRVDEVCTAPEMHSVWNEQNGLYEYAPTGKTRVARANPGEGEELRAQTLSCPFDPRDLWPIKVIF